MRLLMKTMLFVLIVINILSHQAPAKNSEKTASEGAIQILKISPGDERAVIKTADGETKIIKIDDTLGNNGKVTEISKDRIVMEKMRGDDTETIIIRIENGKQAVQRLRKTAVKQPPLLSTHASQETKGDMPSPLKSKRFGYK